MPNKTNTKINKILIVGLGLIGASLCRTLKNNSNYEKIFGHDCDTEVMQYALENNFIDDIKPVSKQKTVLPRINYVWTDMNDGLLSGKKCKNSLLVPFIEGTEPNITPTVRRKCSNRNENPSEGLLDKLKEAFEGGQD